MPSITTLANEATALAHHDESLSAIKVLVEQSDKHQAGYRSSLYGALNDIFDLTRALVEEGAIEGFVKNHGGDWGKVARSNPFQPIVALAFDGSPAASAISKYALVLKYSVQHKPTEQTISEWIEANGGIEKLAALARTVDVPNDRVYDETENERIERAFSQLKSRHLGKVTAGSGYKITDEPALGDYGRALVRHVGGKLEIVSLLPAGREEVRDDLFKLVPREPKCARSKLKAKPFYDLFRVSDVSARLFGKVKGDFVDDTQDEPTKGSSRKTPSPEQRYMFRSGLRFVHRKGKWRAETISVLPTFASVHYDLTEPLPELNQAKAYYLSSHQVRAFAGSFTEVADWTIRVRGNGKSGTYDAAGSGEIVFDELPSDVAWRMTTASRSKTSEFALSQQYLQSLAQWPQDYKRLLDDVPDAASFPKLLTLSIDRAKLHLQFPNFRTGGTGGMLSKVRKLYEAQQQLFATFTSEPDREINARHLARSDLHLLAQLSADYGVSFRAWIYDFNEENAAIALKADQLALVIPLRISLGGDQASTTAMLKADA